MSEDCIGVVLDAGSSTTKAGFASEAFPRATFPTAVARFRHVGPIDGFPLVYCGKEAILRRGVSTITNPVQEGLITNWDEMEKLWHHTFYKELLVAPEEARVMHSVHPLVPEKDKDKMTEILFESFTVKGLYLMKAPVLALHATGKTTGIVWEGGYSCSHVTPVFEGFPLRHATILSPLNGRLLTDRLQKLLSATGYSFTTPFERELLNEMKEKHCFVANECDDARSLSTTDKVPFQLPDGQQIQLGDERVKCPEVLFDPAVESLSCPGLPDLLMSCINKCDTDYKTAFFENIVLAGGTSMFPGLVNRLKAELANLLRNQPLNARIDAMPSRQYAVWMGGSIMASLRSLKGFWVSREEYEDSGTDKIRCKFF